MTRRFMTIPELAAETGLSESTCRHLIHQRRITSVRLGRRRVVTREALDEYVAQQTTAALPPVRAA